MSVGLGVKVELLVLVLIPIVLLLLVTTVAKVITSLRHQHNPHHQMVDPSLTATSSYAQYEAAVPWPMAYGNLIGLNSLWDGKCW